MFITDPAELTTGYYWFTSDRFCDEPELIYFHRGKFERVPHDSIIYVMQKETDIICQRLEEPGNWPDTAEEAEELSDAEKTLDPVKKTFEKESEIQWNFLQNSANKARLELEVLEGLIEKYEKERGWA